MYSMDYITDLTPVCEVLEEEEKMMEEMNADLDKQVQKDMEEIQTFIIPESPSKESPSKEDQDMDEEENIFKTMNEELDKQIAKDMEAIRNYINKTDDSMSKRIEYFNNIDSSHINKCIDRTVTNHILIQHTVLGTIKWHECNQCDYRAKDKMILREHILQKHTDLPDVNWFLCPRCTYITKRSADLQKHLYMVHKETTELGYKCDICSKSYEKESDLFKHKKDKHGTEVFSCEQCDFQTLDRSDLRQHTMTQHLKLNISWYKCAQCSYRTVRKSNLDRHVMYKHSLF